MADAKSPPKKQESRDSVTFSGPVDSVYVGAPDHTLLDVGTGAGVAIDSNHWPEVVVWTPWEAMPSCYKSFVCVEKALVAKPVSLGPGQSWVANMNLSVQNL